jgi:hypothetical protein
MQKAHSVQKLETDKASNSEVPSNNKGGVIPLKKETPMSIIRNIKKRGGAATLAKQGSQSNIDPIPQNEGDEERDDAMPIIIKHSTTVNKKQPNGKGQQQ